MTADGSRVGNLTGVLVYCGESFFKTQVAKVRAYRPPGIQGCKIRRKNKRSLTKGCKKE